MPKTKRPPIDYTPQFGAGIFRPKETIDQELAEMGDAALEITADDEVVPTDTPPSAAPTDDARAPEVSLPKARPLQTNVSTNERTTERNRVRHSFDVWQDQLLGLSEIQAERFSRSGRKPKLGDLVQEALDAYIAKERKRTNVRTNER